MTPHDAVVRHAITPTIATAGAPAIVAAAAAFALAAGLLLAGCSAHGEDDTYEAPPAGPVATAAVASGGSAAAPASTAEAAPAPAPAATADAGRRLTDVPGRIVEVAELGWGIEPDGEAGTRYAPDALPDDMKVDGLRVVFSGEVGEIRPEERRWGTPLRLTAIRRAG